jgi:chorismate mutase
VTPVTTLSVVANIEQPTVNEIPELERLRARLDSIDTLLLDVLRDRLACCAEIGDVKRRHSVQMMQPGRIRLVQQRAANYAAAHGISTDFLRTLYDLIVAETCRLEMVVMGDK